MLSKGSVYKKRLYKFFILVSIVIALILGCLSGYIFFSSNRNNYVEKLRISSNDIAANSKRSSAIITKSLSELMKNEYLYHWASSKNKSEFYYNSLQLSNAIKNICTDISSLDYSIAIANLDSINFSNDENDYNILISPEGSFSIDDYFNKYITSDEKEKADILASIRNFDPVFREAKDKDSESSGYFFYIKPTILRGKNIIYILRFSTESFFGSSLVDEYLIYNDKEILSHNIDKSFNEKSEHSKDYINDLYLHLKSSNDDTTHFLYKGKQIFIITLPYNCKMAILYNNLNPGIKSILTFSLIIIFIQALTFIFVIYITNRVYEPVKELIMDIVPKEDLNKPIDEFEIIKKNNKKIKSLSKSLTTALHENDKLYSQKAVLDLLYNKNPDSKSFNRLNNVNASFSVAILEFEPDRNDNISFVKNLVSTYCFNMENINYVNTAYNRATLILEDMNIQESKIFFSELLVYLDESMKGIEYFEPHISLGSVHNSASEIHSSYKEALKVLDYRHLYNKTKIISFNEISQIDAKSYSYPLSTENRLVQKCIDGDIEAVEIFDHIIRENIMDKDLSKETLQSLIYALNGTLNRIFQELKLSPMELIGKNIDFKSLYDNWYHANTISTLRYNILSIVNAVKSRLDDSDRKLLKDMVNYIYENYSDDIMLNDMAEKFDLSPKYCGILFKDLSGQNFKDFLNNHRIEMAKKYLEKDPNIKIKDLCHMVGFNSSNSLSRVFSKYTGISPTTYAEKHKK